MANANYRLALEFDNTHIILSDAELGVILSALGEKRHKLASDRALTPITDTMRCASIKNAESDCVNVHSKIRHLVTEAWKLHPVK